MAAGTFIVTGGSSGIGEALVERLQRDGGDVIVWDVQEAPRGTWIETDLRDKNSVAAAAEQAPAEVTGFVHCAGMLLRTSIDDERVADLLEESIALHCVSFVQAVRILLPSLEKAGGSVVAITSLAQDVINRDRIVYGTAKAALQRLVWDLSVQLGPRGVRVNGVAPGSTRTRFTAPQWADPETSAIRRRAIPLGRPAEPDEIASAIEFLLSPAASYVNGHILRVDAGLTPAIGMLLSG
jgi:NAD(P)-dependent dehydrogenase (short-subunit alcohol dehydrogenase family)